MVWIAEFAKQGNMGEKGGVMMERETETVSELKFIPIASALQGNTEDCSPEMIEVAHWCVNYLCNPHPDLGRVGVVCPWVPSSMRRETFWMIDIYVGGRSERDVCCDFLELIREFKKREPVSGNGSQYKTVVAVLHGVFSLEKVDCYHALLKPSFLSFGLMLGEFYGSCQKPGLRNKGFRPLRSPVPLLVIREMVELDIAFLADQPSFVDAYLRVYGERARKGVKAVLSQEGRLSLSEKQLVALRKIVYR